MAIAQDAAGFLGGFRQHDGERGFLIGRQRVGFVGFDLVRVVDHAIGGDDQCAQRRDDFVAGGEDFGIGVRQAGHRDLQHVGLLLF
jgi:hypothetical protein